MYIIGYSMLGPYFGPCPLLFLLGALMVKISFVNNSRETIIIAVLYMIVSSIIFAYSIIKREKLV